jgi:hypothetical protein
MHCNKNSILFDHLVGGREQRRRHGEAEHPGRLGVENAALCPSAKALVHDPPVAETRRQITPGNSRSISVKNRVNEQPVIRCSAADMAFSAGQRILDPLPLVVSQPKALHGPALLEADCP